MTARTAITIANDFVLTARRLESGRKLVRSAAVAQLVERELPKLEVAGSKPVRRFKRRNDPSRGG
jgi:hypothetical protein